MSGQQDLPSSLSFGLALRAYRASLLSELSLCQKCESAWSRILRRRGVTPHGLDGPNDRFPPIPAITGPLRKAASTSILVSMGLLLLAVAMVIVLAGALWWLPPRGWWLALSGLWLLGQLMIWWLANDLDNGVPWNLNRPLLTSSDPLWFRAVILLLLYGPLALALWTVRKVRRQ